MTSMAGAVKVLLIDDDEYIAVSLRRYLTSLDWDVDVAADHAAAAALIAERAYGVIVVDPYLTGAVHGESTSLVRRVRELQPDAALIVLTGYGSPALERAIASCGVAALLTKPQSVLALGGAIAAATKHKSS